jgi:hypothetical protein
MALPSGRGRGFLCATAQGGPTMTDSDPGAAQGVLPDHAIRALIASGGIAADCAL